MSVQDQVDNTMWFDTEVINRDFIKGYCQAVYQIRLMLTTLDPEPEGIREYTEKMIDELNQTTTCKTNK